MKFRVRTLDIQALVFSLLVLITAAAKQKKSIPLITCVKKVMDRVLSKIIKKIDMVYIVNDGCSFFSVQIRV